MSKEKDIIHRGIWHNRTEPDYGYREKVFADKWADENQLDCCTNSTLNMLMNGKGINSFKTITQRDADIAATVIQWLGSNVGACFVDECLREIDKLRHQRF